MERRAYEAQLTLYEDCVSAYNRLNELAGPPLPDPMSEWCGNPPNPPNPSGPFNEETCPVKVSYYPMENKILFVSSTEDPVIIEKCYEPENGKCPPNHNLNKDKTLCVPWEQCGPMENNDPETGKCYYYGSSEKPKKPLIPIPRDFICIVFSDIINFLPDKFEDTKKYLKEKVKIRCLGGAFGF